MAKSKEIQEMLRSAETLRGAGRFSEAEGVCRNVLRLHSDNADATHLLAIVLGQLGKAEESVQTLQRLAQLQPNSALVHHNLALALKLAGRFDESIAEFKRAISLEPNLAPAHLNLGITLKDMMRLEEAIECCSNAIQLKPDYADAHWNLALLLLRTGDFKNGLREFEWRVKMKSLSPLPIFAQPRWNGESFSGKTLLLFPEQGFGDAIQFARYIPLAAERGRQVIVASPPPLTRIFERSLENIRVIPFGGEFPAFDLQCSLLSLPLIFGTEVGSIPATIPYLRNDPALVENWRKKIASEDGRLRVGIAWAGNPAHLNDANRSIQPGELLPLTKVNGVQFYSLQKDRAAGPTDLDLIDFTADFKDFFETAAFIETLDLVVTVDTSIAHLAGAIGKATWLLLPFVSDWRWFVGRQNSPWYPTMRLFRQDAAGKWDSVIERVAEQLHREAENQRGMIR